ncbi:peptidoglycan-binding domain-containing protein [Hirschia maritima]|uniref:peptidoglycan-binding domain-containing protein n=1 Tax=Hirschia maritima TaxID=1121961 RepID=UPI000377D9F7|nr:peptidoglycan-binding domain-containing protein [Hirschia maritima]
MATKTLMLSAAAVAGLTGVAQAQNAGYPPEAQPGECFARVLIPETTEIVTEQVVDQPERSEIKVIQAQYETVTETVVVKEATTQFNVVPATYETVTEQVIVEPEKTETIVIPAQIETYTEQVLVRPAYTTWKPGAGLFGRGNAGFGPGAVTTASTGELLCKVEVPAEYTTVTRTRVASPETTDVRVIPARYETVTKQVVAQPAQVVEQVIPAVTETVQVRKMVSPAREEVIAIPATYKTIEKRQVTGGGGIEWREVLCDTNTSATEIAAVQRALTAAGYSVPADGEFGPATLNAMESYQRSNGLPVGYLTMSTVESLGLSF